MPEDRTQIWKEGNVIAIIQSFQVIGWCWQVSLQVDIRSTRQREPHTHTQTFRMQAVSQSLRAGC